jgi:competence protein ComEA
MAALALAAALVSGSALAKKPVVKRELEGVVNLNTATPQQLDLLPGVGATAVKRIMEQRAKAPFTKLEDLSRVKGIGKKKLEKLRPYLAVSGPTTLREKKGAGKPAGEGEAAAVQGRAPPAKR